MSELRIPVDHLRLNYSGPFDANAIHRLITAFTKEKGFDQKIDKEFELETANGKQMEWQYNPWKRISDQVRHWVKMRVLIYDYKKIDVAVDGKKKKIGSGRVVITLDGYVDIDEHNRWESMPLLQAIRTVYTNFIHKAYTERFEQRLTYDIYQLYDSLEKLFGMYRHYKPVSKVPPFASTHA